MIGIVSPQCVSNIANSKPHTHSLDFNRRIPRISLSYQKKQMFFTSIAISLFHILFFRFRFRFRSSLSYRFEYAMSTRHRLDYLHQKEEIRDKHYRSLCALTLNAMCSIFEFGDFE